MATRKPNADELRLHQAALENDKQEISPKEAQAIIPDAKAREVALNFLLRVGLLKSMQDSKGKITFRAVGKAELSATKDLTGEENLVLSHIKASKNEGLWTKHLKAKTNLHQTVIDRCLKTLTQKKLIKRVPSVQHPTRKIYMLEGYDPSVALTGGPWYTDGELDVEFIRTLTRACLKFIQDVSFPKRLATETQQKLYPVTQAPQYPSAETIRKTLKQARLTETELSVEHVDMLLNVLVLDGEIERIPAFGSALWGSQMQDRNEENEDDSDDGTRRKRRRSRRDSSDSDGPSQKRRRGKKSLISETDSDEDRPRKKRGHSVSGSDTSDRRPSKHSRGTKRRSQNSDDASEPSPSKRKKKPKHEDSSTESDDEDEAHGRKDKRKSTTKEVPQAHILADDYGDAGYSVYRALRPEQVSLGWAQSPCSHCPSFEFCQDGGLNHQTSGPVNPRECAYFREWLEGVPINAMEETF